MRSRLFAIALSLPLLAVACATPMEEEDESGETESAISGTVKKGEQYVTTARLNLREGPSTKNDVIITLALGSTVTIIDGTPQNGFYKVDTSEGEGFVFGKYLKDGATKVKEADEDDDDAPATTTGKTGTGKIEACQASFYASGQQTANGETFTPNGLTAAHKTLAFGTMVRVTNTKNGKTVDVRINDRGPFVKGRCIDLARGAFTKIATTADGVASVKVEVLK